MKLITNLSFLLFLSLMLNSCAAKRKAVAESHIKNIKHTAVLVRLQTYENRIKYFNRIGEVQKGETFKRKVEFSNKELIRAFKKEFEFCPAYFFFSNNAKKIKNGDFSEVFLNENLEVYNPENMPDKENFYIIGYDGANVDTEYNPSRAKLVIMDNNFKQLQPPFPHYHGYYYTRLPAQALKLLTDAEYQKRETDEAKAVYLLNKSFNRYYTKIGN